MNFHDVLSREFFRPFATTVVPGAVAIAPYVLLLTHYFPTIGETGKDHSVSTFLVLFVATIAMGLILEDLGARIEFIWDKLLDRQAPEDYHTQTWNKYLQLEYESTKEPIGQHYLRTVLLRMKFELSFGIALLFLLVGGIWLFLVTDCFLITDCPPWYGIIIFATILIGTSIWLFFESYAGSKLLGEIRSLLVCGKTREEVAKESRTSH